MPSKGQSVTGYYTAWNTGAGTVQTGDASNHTVKLIKDGTEATATNSPAEVDSTNCPGLYSIVLTSAEATFNVVKISGKSSTGSVLLFGDTLTFELLPTAAPAANGGLPTVDGSNNVHGLQTRTVSDASVIGTSTLTGTAQSGDAYAYLGTNLGALGVNATALAPASTALSTATWTATKAGYIDTNISSRSAPGTAQTITPADTASAVTAQGQIGNISSGTTTVKANVVQWNSSTFTATLPTDKVSNYSGGNADAFAATMNTSIGGIANGSIGVTSVSEVLVTGTTSPATAGTYTLNGMCNGLPCYYCSATGYYIFYFPSTQSYYLTNHLGTTGSGWQNETPNEISGSAFLSRGGVSGLPTLTYVRQGDSDSPSLLGIANGSIGVAISPADYSALAGGIGQTIADVVWETGTSVSTPGDGSFGGYILEPAAQFFTNAATATAEVTFLQAANAVGASPTPGKINFVQGNTESVAVSNTGDWSTATQIWFTVKPTSVNVADAQAVMQVTQTGGLVRLGGSSYGTGGDASLVYSSANSGTVTLTISNAAVTAALTPGTYVYDFKGKNASSEVTFASGTLTVLAPVTQST